MRTLDVVAVGELNPDLILGGLPGLPRLGQEILAGRCTFTLGSSTALCAANLAALGLRVGLVGKIGDDLFGDFILPSLDERKIDTSRVIRDPTVRTGVTVSLAYPQDRAMMTYLGAMASLRADEVDLEYVCQARHLHLSSLFLQQALQEGCADLFRAAKSRGVSSSLDPGWDPNETWDAGIGKLYPWLDVLFLNEGEAVALGRRGQWRDAAAHLAKHVPTVVVKRGRDGAGAIHQGMWFEHAGFAIEAVDPTGAGDAFNAGFLFGRLSGWPIPDCLTWGSACGAMTAAHLGGSGAFTDRDEVESFIRSRVRS